ncbi:carboxyl-terminal processing protease [Aeribacillus composti]|uniref:S41 family peptidase n=1 Tax=Aeribacillus composti TaxID=1868734 RepID=UPI00119BA9EF|nr:S41 family peptidase [Aeribacillus composti]TVZ85268.1 carboxyl-terminal processing protease [Aeribacillus composti]
MKQIIKLITVFWIVTSSIVVLDVHGHAENNESLENKTIAASAQSSDETIPGLEKFINTYELISEKYVHPVDKKRLLEGAIQGMLSSLGDPYSVYMDKETVRQFTESLDSSFEGIGAEIGMNNGKITIISPFKNSPAEKAGLKPNDEIVKIDGKTVSSSDLHDAVLKIRGEKGTTVKLTIRRPGSKDLLFFEVKRDEIPIETVFSSEINKNGKRLGVLHITSFSERTADDFKQKLKMLEKKKINGLVIDVRGNPGGYLQAVEQILQQLVPNHAPYIQIEKRDGKREMYYSTLKEKKHYPIAVLIDNGSASASEILAAALKEAGGYAIVGEKSFGKGTVQQTIPLDDGSNIKLTLYKWLTPKGNWIHEKGVEPTVKISQPDYFKAGPLDILQPLKKEMNNEQVRIAQILLSGLGYDPGRKDGYFSAETELAVKAFQKMNGLSVTGKLDQKTAIKMNELITKETRSKQNDLQLQTAISLLARSS